MALFWAISKERTNNTLFSLGEPQPFFFWEKRKGRRAQAGTEYLIVVSIGILLLIPVLIIGQNYISDLSKNSDQLLARQALNKIEGSAKLVYAQGEPSKITLNVKMPENINSTRIQDELLIITLGYQGQLSDVISIVDFPINGTLPTNSGNRKISIEAKTNATSGEVYVQIS